MALPSIEAVPFERPGGEELHRCKSRPIDLAHLSRQTMGDRALEQEVLGLFVTQALSVRDRLAAADVKERKRLAHGLKGSARGVGAFKIAEIAGEIEAEPTAQAALGRLARAVDEVREFIAAITR